MSVRERPTLGALRQTVQKGRHREIGNWLARRWARPTAVHGTWLAVRLGLSAHQVTALALAAGLGGALAIGTGTRWGFVGGVLLMFLSFWLDHVDGQVARWRQTSGLSGVYLDYLMHHALAMCLGFALGFGLSLEMGQPRWSVAGFAVAMGWTFLSLHNDCRYKAFFQRLKLAGRTYRVDGGSGGRPEPPRGWPRRGLGVLSWPLLKLCEAHVVLICLAMLAVLMVAWPETGSVALRLYVGGMAVVAPVLAAGRLARATCGGAAEKEFERWFQPWADA